MRVDEMCDDMTDTLAPFLPNIRSHDNQMVVRWKSGTFRLGSPSMSSEDPQRE